MFKVQCKVPKPSWGSLIRVMKDAQSGDSTVLLRDLESHVGNDSETENVTGRNGLPNLNTTLCSVIVDASVLTAVCPELKPCLNIRVSMNRHVTRTP